MFFSTEPKLSLETKIHKKPMLWSQKILAYLSSYYRVSQTSRMSLLGFTRYFDNYCGNSKIISVTPRSSLKKMLFEIKRYSSSEKN